MTQQKFKLTGPIRNAEFSVREDNTLAIHFNLKAGGSRVLVFHDFLRKAGNRFYLFNKKTEINQLGNTVVIRTAAAAAEDGEPVPGLLVTYRFNFDKKVGAFYVSVSYGSDVRCSGYSVKLMDVSWEGMEVNSFTGYEYDADDRPFSHRFSMPSEKNPLAPDYETLMRIRPHVAWERMKTRPLTFKNGVAVHGDNGYFAVWGGTPTFHVEAEYVNVFTNIDQFDYDLRYYSGKNSPGAWFFLEEPEDIFAAVAELNKRAPEMPEHVMAPFVEKKVKVTAGALEMNLRQTGNGVWVEPFFADKDTPCQPWPLFHIDLWDTQYERSLLTDAGDGWDRVEILEKKNYIRVTLSDPDSGRVAGITVVAEAFLEPVANRINWKMRIVNRSDRWSVTKITYPQGLAHGYKTGFAPVGSGSLLKQFNQRSYTFRGKYPTGVKVNMSFLALYNDVAMDKAANSNNGLYMGIHDPDGGPKFLYMNGAPQSDCTGFSADCVPHYQRHAGNSFTLPGTLVWQSFSGDWFDATEIYRNFVFSQAKWLSPLRGRDDSPEWMRNNPVWIMHFMPNENPDANPFPITLREKYADKNPEDWYRTAVRFRQEIGVPVAYHLYNWHWVPFNNDNPHYFPTHSDLKAGMAELKKADIRVVPYIAGYSWDMCDRRGGDYRFEQEALPSTAKNINGEPIFTSYASTEPTGQPVRFARMCPTTTTWKNEVRQIVKKLYSDFKMDGIYLDVVSTAYEMCCDENHLHIPGHGDFWWKAYCELITGLRADAPEDFAFVSESTSEVYSGILDGYLSWTWVQIDGVPAHSRVYGGRTSIFGRVITQNKRDDVDYFRFNIAQSLLYGQQLGWIHPEIVDDPVQFPFLKKMANIRWDNRDFFVEAEMLRPPVVEGKMPMLDCEAFLRGQIWNHEKLAMAAAWEDASGNRKLFVINAGGEEADVTLSVYEKEYALPKTIDAFDVQDGFEILGMESKKGVRKIHCRIAPEGVGILNW